MPNQAKRSFSRPFVTISINIEGLSGPKETILADMCQELGCDILAIQETHRGPTRKRPRIDGMQLIAEQTHDQYGSAIFAKESINIKSTSMTDQENVETLTVEMENISITSIYKPPGVEFKSKETNGYNRHKANIILGDFNCRSTSWGYSDTNKDEEELEKWSETNNLNLLHDPKLPCSFSSKRWKKGTNPDNIFVSTKIASRCIKTMGNPIPHTQHRPIICTIKKPFQPEEVPFKRRFNFRKADWLNFKQQLDDDIMQIEATPENYEAFIDLVGKISRKNIPRGCRTKYIPGIDGENKRLLQQYEELYSKDPFAEDTLQTEELITEALAQDKRSRWGKLLEDLDMKQNSRRAWKLVKNLCGDPTKAETMPPVTPDQVATQLLLNGKTNTKKSKEKLTRDHENEKENLKEPFTAEELTEAIKNLKPNKAAGMDDLRAEQLKHFGPRALQWLLKLFNTCIQKLKIPKLWRKARVVALLKPGKDPTIPKSYRPVSLLCQLYKVMERMVLNRISGQLESEFIPEQAGFRPGKSCCSQILNLTQHIEDGFEQKSITGVAFIDLSAAYDTVNHRILLRKLYEITKDFQLVNIIKTFLQNRRFYVTLQNKTSRWRNQKNGLPQGSVLAPILYNVYTNDIPMSSETRKFIYADDTAVAAQGKSYPEVEDKLEKELERLSDYYEKNHLRPNPSKTQICAFHLRNRVAKKELNITWQDNQLVHCPNPTYLGVTLDRTLSFKKHCLNTKGKVHARNNILRKLVSKKWGAQPSVLRTTALALCMSAAEYAAPVWARSAHSKQVNIAVNETARIVTGCLRPTPTGKLYPLIGVAPPDIRRNAATGEEKAKQESDPRHPLFHHSRVPSRLKSRRSFMATAKPLQGTKEVYRREMWKEELNTDKAPLEKLQWDDKYPFTIWKTINRLKTGTGSCKANLEKWNLLPDGGNTDCSCGQKQDMSHLLNCPDLGIACTMDDLDQVNDNAISAATYWMDQE